MNIQLLSERVLLVTAAVVTSAIAAGETIRYDFARELPQWTIAPAGTIEATAIAGGVRLKVVQAQNRGDGALVRREKLPLSSDRFAFSAEAVGDAGYLQVKTWRNGRETGRYSSDDTTGRMKRRLRCEFPLDGADYIEVCLRMKLNKRHLGKSAEFRDLRLEPVVRDPLEVVPLYHSASYYCNVSSPQEPPPGKVEFRLPGGAWQRAYPPVWSATDRQLRGSIVDLKEDTLYELRFTPAAGKPLIRKFRTWKSAVPVGRTVDIGKRSGNETIEITGGGTPDGYLRLTGAPGTVLAGGDRKPVLRIRDAKYVILENLTIRGGAPSAVVVNNSRHILFRNCDISGWGTVGRQRLDLDGKFYDDRGRAVNYTAGIEVMNSDAVTVERCRIDEPRNRANPWFFSHPAGPQALFVGNVSRMVVRWNDFIGCEFHRWNDVVEGWGNFNRDGGFARDCDIYGNCFAFGNDDAIELDGGQKNVRFFDNWIEGTYCGVSTCGCMCGPSYAFRNLIANLGDEMLGASASFKSGRGDGMLHIFSNTLLGGSGVICTNPELRAVTRNNLIQVGGQVIYERRAMPGNSFDYDLCYSSGGKKRENILIGPSIGPHMILAKTEFLNAAGADYVIRPGAPGAGAAVEVPNFAAAGQDMGCRPDGANFPPRPGLGFTVDAARLEFSSGDAPAQFITLKALRDCSFRIERGRCFNWVSVTPGSGTLKAGERRKLAVKPIADRLGPAGVRRGGFSIRQKDGFSRPVLVYVRNDRAEEIPAESRAAAVFRHDRHVPFTTGRWEFEVAKPQACYVVVRLGALPPRLGKVTLRLDGMERTIGLRTRELYNYPMVAKGGYAFLARPEKVQLEPGRHTFELRADVPVLLEWAVVTPNPWPLFTRFQR